MPARPLLALPAVALLLASCEVDEPVDDGLPDWPLLEAGELKVGTTRAFLDLPVGLPLGGYTARDQAVGSERPADPRDSDYTTDFIPSAGWQTRIPLNVAWIEDGTRTAVVVQLDLIYSSDFLTEELGRALTEALGRDLTDSVFTITNHSHSSYGDFSRSMMLALGTDFWRWEVIERMVGQMTDAALRAHDAAVPARMGLGIDPDFDPIGQDRVFRDRRGENDELLGPGGEVTGPGWKDERLTILRADALDGTPLLAWFAFGIHGTVEGPGNHLITSEAPGHIQLLLQERHGGPLWMFGQGAGGDASPAGSFDSFARMESLGERAADAVLALYESIELSDGPVTIEPLQRYVTQDRSMRVTRDGAVDLHYMPWDPDWADWPYIPDMRIWGDDGEILSPIDEFWTQYGAALCGEPSIDISILGLDVDLPAYRSCIDIDRGYVLFRIAFPEYITSREVYDLPLPSTRTAMLGALGLRSIPVTVLGEPDVADEDVVFAFAPGETTTLWTQFLRHRAGLRGIDRTVVIGYAMDHEGYLLTTDDWLMAGYESSITVWGPLQGEHMLERMLDLLELAASPEGEDADWPDFPGETEYRWFETPLVTPDVTPEAGTVDEVTDLWTWTLPPPGGSQPEPEVRRVQGVARFSFVGGDAALGLPTVVIERETEGGGWEPLRTPAGNPISDALPDLVVTYTPDPLLGGDGADPVRTHRYHAAWQAVQTWTGLQDRASLPLGRYRFQVSGLTRDPADDEYPFEGLPWSLASEPFELVPAEVEARDATWTGERAELGLAYARAPHGWRLLDLGSGPRSPHPVQDGGLVARAEGPGGGEETWTVEDRSRDGDVLRMGVRPAAPPASGTWTLRIDDGHGNVGSATLEVP